MYKYLGRLATGHPWLICLTWILAGVVVGLYAPSWDGTAQDDDIHFLPADTDSVRGHQLLSESFPKEVFASKVIFVVERPDGALTKEDYSLVDRAVDDLKQLGRDEPGLKINTIYSHSDPFIGKRLVSEDRKCTLIQVSLECPYLALQTRDTVNRAEQVVRRRWDEAGAAAPRLFVSGPAGVGRDLTTAGASSLDATTIATIILVIVILLFVYRAPLLAFVPLATIAVAVYIALKLLALCTLIPGFYLVNISQIFAVVMLYGAGTDYCLFLISRYREELAAGHDEEKALQRAIKGVGSALVASAATVICGLSLMALADFAKVRSGGPAIAISLTVALVASLTLAPALLRIFGRRLFWPMGVPEAKTETEREDFWTKTSRAVTAHPVAIWVCTVVLLLPLALLGLKVQANYRATSELSTDSSSVQGLAVIQKHFTAGEVGPITVLLEADKPWSNEKGRRIITQLSSGFARLDNVAEVRSMTQPLGEPLNDPKPAPKTVKENVRANLFKRVWNKVSKTVTQQIQYTAEQHYIAEIEAKEANEPKRYVTRIDVVLKSDPFEPESSYTLDVIQLWLAHLLPEDTASFADVRTETYGVTVNARDLATVTENDRVRINGLVVVGIFLILLVLVRKAWMAGYLLVTVLFSYYVTLGVTTLAAHLWLGRPIGVVDWRVPFFLFTILVAVGEDYNILLIARMLKEKRRKGSKEGTEHALSRTGGTITSCGLIMAGTFATLMLAGLSTLVQIGFALAFGVLLDTFVVRPLLVPAFVYWVWKHTEPDQPKTKLDVIFPLPERPYYRKAG